MDKAVARSACGCTVLGGAFSDRPLNISVAGTCPVGILLQVMRTSRGVYDAKCGLGFNILTC